MALYRCVATGIYPSTTGWDFTQYCSSSISLSAAGSAWNTAVSALWSGATAHFATSVALSQTTVYEVDPATGIAGSKVVTGNSTPGTGTGQPLPPDVAVCVSKTTVQLGPEGRGRFYLPPLVAGDLSAGFILAGTVTTLVSAVKAMYDSLTGASMTPVVYGLKSKIIFNQSGFSIDNKWDSQRRRSRKMVGSRTTSPL